MSFLAQRAAVMIACLLAALSAANAQGNAGACRQGVLALIMMIEADEHDKSHYRSTAVSTTEACGVPASAKPANAAASFDKPACSKLAHAMLEGMVDSKMENAGFTQARDAFAGQCLGK